MKRDHHRMEHHLLPSEIDTEHYLFYSPTSVDEDVLQGKGGRWILHSPKDLKKLDNWWPVLQKLCNDGTLVAMKSSTATDQVFCLILCYTSDFDNEEEVKGAADEIRKLINYEYPLYYSAFKRIAGQNHSWDNVYLYVHTVNGEFYKKKIPFLLPSDVYWKLRVNYSKLLPDVRLRNEQIDKGGQWRLYCFADMNELDRRWMVLQSLCDDDVLIRIESSTSLDPRRGLTTCYTPDYKNILEVKKAADEIRKLIHYGYAMIYTIVELSTTTPTSGAATIVVKKYMHTVKGGFYKKDELGRWISLNV